MFNNNDFVDSLFKVTIIHKENAKVGKEMSLLGHLKIGLRFHPTLNKYIFFSFA